MSINAQIDMVADTVTGDKNSLEQFQKEPGKTVKKIIGIDIPDDIVNQVVTGVKNKISIGKIAEERCSPKKMI